MAKVKSAIITALIVGGTVTSLMLNRQLSAAQRASDLSLRQGAGEIGRLRLENKRLAELAGQADTGVGDQAELLRLRAEAAEMGQKLEPLPGLRRENQRLLTALAQAQTPLQAREETMAKGAFVKNWMAALITFSMEHDGRFPTNFAEAAPFLQAEARAETNIATSAFDIVYQGDRAAIVNPDETIVIREKQAWLAPGPKWYKEFGFANGVAQLHSEPDGNFEAYEAQHTVPARGLTK